MLFGSANALIPSGLQIYPIGSCTCVWIGISRDVTGERIATAREWSLYVEKQRNSCPATFRALLTVLLLGVHLHVSAVYHEILCTAGDRACSTGIRNTDRYSSLGITSVLSLRAVQRARELTPITLSRPLERRVRKSLTDLMRDLLASHAERQITVSIPESNFHDKVMRAVLNPF